MPISDVVGRTVLDFINYALGIALIMVIYYAVKFFLVAPPTKEEKERKLQSQREAWQDTIQKYKEKSKKRRELEELKKEKKRKKDLVSPVKDNLVHAIEAADEALSLLTLAKTPDEREKILELAKAFNRKMEHARKNLRVLRRNVERSEWDFVNKCMEQAEAIEEYVTDNFKKKLPEMSAAFRNQVVSEGIPSAAKKARGMVHELWKKLEEFHQ